MSFSAKVKRELYPLQKNYFTLLEKKLTIIDCELEVPEPDEDDLRASIRGAFLLGGSISDPSKSYHLEIVTRTEPEASGLKDNMAHFGVEGHIHQRKSSFVVYVKDASDIVSMLGVMGARMSLMEYENARIINEMRGSVNRRVNCETANIKRTVNTAVRQIEAICKIKSTIGLSALPAALREMAEVRLAYPESSLSQLGEYLHPAVGKSGVNHRLRKIIEIAEEI